VSEPAREQDVPHLNVFPETARAGAGAPMDLPPPAGDDEEEGPHALD
jgi:hypothetical protein